MKKIISVLLLVTLMVCALTGCVAANTTTDDVARPAVTAVCGETALTPTVESEEPAESVTAEDGSVGEPLDTNIYNPVAKDSVITISGNPAAKSVCYRINSGDPVVVKAATAEITVTADLDKLETYITGTDGIVSEWATFFFEVA